MSLSRITLTLSASIVLLGGVFACSDDSASSGSGGSGASSGTSTGGNNTGGAGTSSGGNGAGGTAQGGNGAGGSSATGGWPSGTPCGTQIYDCSDGLDNDNDGLIDAEDPECFHPCDNSEASLAIDISGGDSNPNNCNMDCFFDTNSGQSNGTDCAWSHRCDPLSVAPNYYPQPSRGTTCAYQGQDATPPGNPASCGEMFTTQLDECKDMCKPLTPNGCDCFGCCNIPLPNNPSQTVTIFLGSKGVDSSAPTECTFAKLDDPTVCHPCTQVPSCLNDCGPCEICVGKPAPGPGCNSGTGGGGQGGGTPGEQCPAGVQACGLPGQSPCPSGFFCNTGCCYAIPS